MNKTYMCIDLKSFYASVECVERGLDPIKTNLVVADASRTDKTICLAVTPALKKYGLSGRSRLFEVNAKVKEINKERLIKAKKFIGKSIYEEELEKNDKLSLDFIAAPPRMLLYMKYSTDIYNIYLKYIDKEDILVYSIDEVFMDITNYLNFYKLTPRELATKIIHDVYNTTGITATSGIGTNMYLAKVAMDIVAKHTEPDEFGVRIAELDEMSYRHTLWDHMPLTDFWRIGKGTKDRLNAHGMYTMGDICRCSINNENLLYKLFGVNAELVIDHAWGYEPCTIKDAKGHDSSTVSLSSGQVLHQPYTCSKARLIVKEMMELLSLQMVEKNYVTDQIVLTIGYDVDNLNDIKRMNMYDGEITKDYLGRLVPKPSHGTIRVDHKTSSTKTLIKYILELYDRIVIPVLLIRRINIAVCNLVDEDKVKDNKVYQQVDMFTLDYEIKQKEKEIQDEKSEHDLQKAMISIKNKYGKNAILKGMNLEEGGTTIERNGQVGGHKG